MIIKVLGPGCSKCVEAYEIVSKAVAASGSDATVEKITDLREIMALGVLATPAVAASCARGASPARKKSGAGSAPNHPGARHTTGNDGRAVPAMPGLRGLCCKRAKMPGREAGHPCFLPDAPCPACLSLRPIWTNPCPHARDRQP